MSAVEILVQRRDSLRGTIIALRSEIASLEGQIADLRNIIDKHEATIIDCDDAIGKLGGEPEEPTQEMAA